MKKKIGIRYCGGCRSQYDRVAAAEKIKNALKACGVEVGPVEDAADEPAGLVICGCPAQCAGREDDLPQGWHILGPGNLFDRKEESLETMAKILCREAGKRK